jgi:hypothetical protein
LFGARDATVEALFLTDLKQLKYRESHDHWIGYRGIFAAFREICEAQ